MITQNNILIKVTDKDIIDGKFSFPSNITEIAEGAFSSCSNLTEISIPSSIKKIPERAFEKCNNLKKVSLPKTIEEIGDNAFNSCFSLSSIKFPASLSSIGDSAFFACSNLENIEIPSNVKNIGKSSFSKCRSLRKIIIENGVENIGNGAFSECKSLPAIFLPNSIKCIGDELFKDCSNLITIKLSDNLESISNACFLNCSSLSGIRIPENIKEIGEYAFGNCRRLTEFDFNNIESIGENAFDSCFGLKSVNLPDTIKILGDNVFNYCNSLQTAILPDNLKSTPHGLFNHCGALRFVHLPNSLERIGCSCFFECYSLQEVEIPDSVKKIDNYAFQDCTSLKSLKLPSSLTEIGKNAFCTCNSIVDIVVPESVEQIGDFAFNSCLSLKSVVLPEKINKINQGLFAGCHSLENVNIPENVTILDDNAFASCYSLVSINIPSNLKVIGNECFSSCIRLENLSLPHTVTYIGKSAFAECSAINSLFIPSSVINFENQGDNNLKFFTKLPDGFNLSASQNESAIPLEELKINLAILSNFWEHRNTLINQQKDKNICNFYNTFLSTLSKEQMQSFIENHNFKFFKQFPIDEKNLQNYDFYKLLYNLGAFLTPFEVNGKSVNYSQKVSEFLLEKIRKGEFKIEDSKRIFEVMKTHGFKKEFTDFFISNFGTLMNIEDISPKFTSRCYNEFEEVQKTNTNNRGSQRQLKPTLAKFVDYFQENKYSGITPETKPIADTIAHYYSSQLEFDQAVSIFEEFKKNNTPAHILDEPLAERTVFDKIDKLSNNIESSRMSTLSILFDTAEKQFSYEWLAKNDPQNLILGKLCSCCAHLSGAGYGIMRAGIIHPNVQNLVIRDNYGAIVAKATLYINPNEGYGVFNTVQIDSGVQKSSYQAIYDKFILGVKAFAEKYNKKHPDKPIRQINVGMGLNNLDNEIRKNNKITTVLNALDYSKFGTDKYDYEGDSASEQFVIWSDNQTQNEKQM